MYISFKTSGSSEAPRTIVINYTCIKLIRTGINYLDCKVQFHDAFRTYIYVFTH